MIKDRNEIKDYLDTAIRSWRKNLYDPNQEEWGEDECRCYIDAFQSVRKSIFGELLPPEEHYE